MGKFLIVLTIALSAGVISVVFFNQPVERNAADLCPVTGEKGLEVVVVDKTDEWNYAQVSRLKRLIDAIRNNIQLDERLSIFAFQGRVEYGFEPVFSVCSPGRGSETSRLTGNPNRVEREFDRRFGAPLEAVLRSLQQPTSGDQSPILEVLVDLTRREEFRSIGAPYEITIISDMIQHTPLLSLYSDFKVLPDPKEVSAGAGSGDFSGFSLHVYQIKGKYPTERLQLARTFWERWSQAYGIPLEWSDL